jgi:hypothetical protein
VLPVFDALDDKPFSPAIFFEIGNDNAKVDPGNGSVRAFEITWFFGTGHLVSGRIIYSL